MGNKINQKLGLRPATRQRAMMHDARSPHITRLQCVFEDCRDRWILENIVHGQAIRNCARCGRRQPMAEATA